MAATVQAAVQSMVGSLSLQDRGAGLVAEGLVTAEPGGRWLLRVRVDRDGASEAKTIAADSCVELADAYAVIVAFAVDPSARPSPLDSPSPGGASRDQKSAQEEVVTPLVAAPPTMPLSASKRAPPFGIGPVVAMAAGLLPFPAVGVGGRLSLEAGPRWEIAGTYWPERGSSVIASANQSVGARIGLVSVQPSVCGSLWRGAATVCGGAEAGAMHATGTAVPTIRTGTSWWLAPTSSLTVRLSLAPGLALRFRLDVGIPIFRPIFVLDRVGPTGSVVVHTPGAVFGVFSLEPELIFFSTDRGDERHARK